MIIQYFTIIIIVVYYYIIISRTILIIVEAYMNDLEQTEMKITSIVCMSLFAVSSSISIVGLLRSSKATNKSFLKIFFVQILIISLLQIGTGVLVFINTNFKDIRLSFIQRCINSFSVVFQFALILTISYGWKVACWKIKQSTSFSFHELRKKRILYITVVCSLFFMEFVANFMLLIYLLITGKTSEFVLNVFDFVLQTSILGGIIAQMVQGGKLSLLLTRYQILFGVKMNRWRFNLVYIVAFILNMGKCLMQMSALVYYFINQKIPGVIDNNTLAYYLLYMILQIIPMMLYLLAIKVSGEQDPIERDSSIDSNSNRNSLETQMVNRTSMDI